VVAGLVVVGIGVATVAWRSMSGTPAAKPVTVPQLSMRALIGKEVYDKTCVACHGADAAGTDHGPPFVHAIYNPGHHADEAFYRAVRQGVPAHHWRFGDMPPQPDVTDQQVGAILNYVRELQQANGIVTQPHRM
ncbi:cytochrome c, partial [Mycobacterium tuberculosis]|nr:cytochrome c [Mycobacterium tuberculosis]